MSSKPVVAVVQPLTSAAMVAPAVRAAGMSPVAVVDYTGPALASLRGGYDPQAYDAVVNHRGDVEGTLAKLRALAPSAVIPGVEASLRLAQILADELTPDDANITELVDARRHKYVMHQALAKAGLPIIRQICTTDPEEVAAWIEREGLTGQDLVIKPTSSAGTVGVTRAPGGEGWRDRFNELLGTYDKLGVLAEDVQVQEHMTGTEYAIDTVSHHGKHSITDIIKCAATRCRPDTR
jgi:biotin carboxylase